MTPCLTRIRATLLSSLLYKSTLAGQDGRQKSGDIRPRFFKNTNPTRICQISPDFRVFVVRSSEDSRNRRAVLDRHKTPASLKALHASDQSKNACHPGWQAFMNRVCDGMERGLFRFQMFIKPGHGFRRDDLRLLLSVEPVPRSLDHHQLAHCFGLLDGLFHIGAMREWD